MFLLYTYIYVYIIYKTYICILNIYISVYIRGLYIVLMKKMLEKNVLCQSIHTFFLVGIRDH